MSHLRLDDSTSRLTGARRPSDIQTQVPKGGDSSDLWPAVSPLRGESRHFSSSETGIVGPCTSELTKAWRTTKLADVCSYFEHRDYVQMRNRLATLTGTVAAAVATYIDSQLNILEIDRLYVDLRRNLWAHMFRDF
jgi:hypothetical protein